MNMCNEDIDSKKNITQITACYNWPEEEAAKVYLDAVKEVVAINTLF
jgi:hypothetical protein